MPQDRTRPAPGEAPAPLRAVLILAAGGPAEAARADALVAPPGLPGSLPPGPPLYARLAPDLAGLEAALAHGCDGILLGGVEDPRVLARIGARLAVHEAQAGLPDGCLRLLVSVETPRGVLALPALAAASPRLAGLGWDAQALAARLGLAGAEALDGIDPAPLAAARGALVLAAAAAGVPALDSALPRDLGDAHLAERVARARRDGFSGVFARDAAGIRAAAAGFS
ncbi:aldolase/citrate lyase family protein [Methylobacterium sp. A54F]